MDLHHSSIQPYQNSPAHHLQHPQPLQHPAPQSFAHGFVPSGLNPHLHHHAQQFFRPQPLAPNAPAAALNASFPPVPGHNLNALRYPQSFNLPVHNGIPVPQQPSRRPNEVPQPPTRRANEAQQPRRQKVAEVAPPVEAPSETALGKPDKHLRGLKCILEPPDKDLWRHRLFEVEGLLILTEEQFQVYFPHVDNVYSHRSTQDYKKKPFISHYYDCRLKGRPAGTPKSDDPNKKKRKRVARERDLCDVKIKITEYQPGASREDIEVHLGQQPRSEGISAEELLSRVQGAVGKSWQSATSSFGSTPAQSLARFYTIQRVNGTGPHAKREESGKHRHTLEESDRIKKNSVVRALAIKEKDKKKSPEKKQYHTKATGTALATVKKRSTEHSLKLYGSCFCPFVQRVWISLERKEIPYQYIEVDPYLKPEWYLKLNPRGLVPTLQDGDWCCYESTVLMEYLEDLGQGTPLLPMDAKKRAHSRLWSDHINRKIIPKFYAYLQAQEPDGQKEHGSEMKDEIEKLVKAADPEGPFFLGRDLGFVDIQFAPWVIRLSKVLKPYRGWPDADPESRWGKWIAAIEENEFVRATTSGDQLYLDSYERYAENRPNTSQVANAINAGRSLP